MRHAAAAAPQRTRVKKLRLDRLWSRKNEVSARAQLVAIMGCPNVALTLASSACLPAFAAVSRSFPAKEGAGAAAAAPVAQELGELFRAACGGSLVAQRREDQRPAARVAAGEGHNAPSRSTVGGEMLEGQSTDSHRLAPCKTVHVKYMYIRARLPVFGAANPLPAERRSHVTPESPSISNSAAFGGGLGGVSPPHSYPISNLPSCLSAAPFFFLLLGS